MKLVIAMAALLPASAVWAGQTGAPTGHAQLISPAPETPPLDERAFWALVDQSAKFRAKPDVQLASLRTSLSQLSPDRIAGFERVFDQVMRRSYSWDLWGAASLANGGASDDGFEYFRCWLIAQGHKTFERVLANPDTLADAIPPGALDILEFEDFAYVARGSWAAKTGRDWNEMPFVANMMYAEGPKGVPFSDNPADLAKRYAKLWARFGN